MYDVYILKVYIYFYILPVYTGVVAARARNAFQALEMTARRKKRPKNQVPRSSLKRSCGAIKRG